MNRFADVALDRFFLNGKQIDGRVRNAIAEAHLVRTINGPSSLTVTFDDTDRELIRSELFNRRTRVNLDGYVFAFDSYTKIDDQLDVTFISGGWADLRAKRGPLVARAGTTTRTRFARRLVSEVGYLKFRGESGSRNLVVLKRGKKERSTKALERLARDRQWRVFEDEETIFFGSDAWLLERAQPFVISEADAGINYINPEYNGGKLSNRATVDCYVNRWAAGPGNPVETQGLGDLAGAGLWLVESLNRSLFSDKATIDLVRKTPELPETKPAERRHHDSRRGTGGGSSGAPGPTSSSGWQWPIQGPITGRFGDDRGDHSHGGLDIDGQTGDPIRASKPGIVTSSYFSSSYGNVIIVDHGGGWSSLYAHLSVRLVGAGQRVGYDTIVGRMGSTGNSTGSHLHFEIRRNGSPVNPASYLP